LSVHVVVVSKRRAPKGRAFVARAFFFDPSVPRARPAQRGKRTPC